MTRCPTCRAPYRGGTACYRCGTRLRSVLAVEREADACLLDARVSLQRRDLAAAQGFADRALFLDRSRAALETAALVALACRDFDAACALWREAKAAARGG